MTKSKLNNLLKKTKWTGEEVGKAIFSNKIYELNNPNEAKSSEHYFTRSELEKMKSSLTEQSEIDTFNTYAILTQLVDTLHDKSVFCEVQFQNAYYREYYKLEELQSRNQVLKIQENYPVIFTDYQLQKIKELIKDNRAHYTEPLSCVYFDIIESVINDDIQDKDISKALEDLKKEKVSDKDILLTYNKSKGIGSYQDKETLDTELKTDLSEDEKTEQEFYKYELLFKGAEAIKRAYKNKTGKNLSGYSDDDIIKSYRAVIHDLEEFSIPEIKELKVLEDPLKADTKEWITSDELENLSKYDLFESDFFQTQIVEDFLNEKYKSPLLFLKTECQDLFNIVDKYIKDKLPKYKDLSLEEILKTSIYFYELKDFIPFINSKIEDSYFDRGDLDEIFTDDKDLFISENFYIRHRIDKSGYVIGKDLENLYGSNIYNQDLRQKLNTCIDITETKDSFIVTYNREKIKKLYSDMNLSQLDNDKYKKEIKKSNSNISKEYILNKLKNRIEISGVAFIDEYSDLISLRSLNNDEYQKQLLNSTHWYIIWSYQYLSSINALYDILSKIFKIDKKLFNSIKRSTEDMESLIDSFNKRLYLFNSQIYGNQKDIEEQRSILHNLFKSVDIDKIKPTKARITKASDIISEHKDDNPRDLLSYIFNSINVIADRELW